MADVVEMMSGPARDWLAANRQALNGRFRLAQRRFPRLDGQAVLALCHELLPPLAGAGENGSADLLSTIYDLILLHAGRGTLAPRGVGSLPGIGMFMRETMPRLRRLLLARPSLSAALSNAVENLGLRGIEFARTMATMADSLPDSDAVHSAGAVLAWRLGEARLRSEALEKARALPPRSALIALGLADWPEQAAPLVVAGLAADGWRRPEETISTSTLAGLPKLPAERLQSLLQEVAALPPEAPSSWRLAGRLGNFIGFDGHFRRPPLLLDAGNQGSRQRFWARSGDEVFRIDADVFGWVCRPAPSADVPVSQPAPSQDEADRTRSSRSGGRRKQQTEAATAPIPARATSCLALDDSLAFTRADSFRIRIITPLRKSL